MCTLFRFLFDLCCSAVTAAQHKHSLHNKLTNLVKAGAGVLQKIT